MSQTPRDHADLRSYAAARLLVIVRASTHESACWADICRVVSAHVDSCVYPTRHFSRPDGLTAVSGYRMKKRMSICCYFVRYSTYVGCRNTLTALHMSAVLNDSQRQPTSSAVSVGRCVKAVAVIVSRQVLVHYHDDLLTNGQ